jgi:hypothetical protein
VPADPDERRLRSSAGRATLIDGRADDVAFLDAAGVGLTELIDAVDETLATRPTLSVLTVYSDDPACRPALDELCRRHEVAVVATIPHDGRGTTFTLRCRPSA